MTTSSAAVFFYETFDQLPRIIVDVGPIQGSKRNHHHVLTRVWFPSDIIQDLIKGLNERRNRVICNFHNYHSRIFCRTVVLAHGFLRESRVDTTDGGFCEDNPHSRCRSIRAFEFEVLMVVLFGAFDAEARKSCGKQKYLYRRI